MLEANQDCEKCAGDCPKGSCQRPLRKMCGQGVEGRGCGVQHHLHELFCAKAKENYEVVLWDTGSDTNYLRQEHAENQGFPY